MRLSSGKDYNKYFLERLYSTVGYDDDDDDDDDDGITTT